MVLFFTILIQTFERERLKETLEGFPSESILRKSAMDYTKENAFDDMEKKEELLFCS